MSSEIKALWSVFDEGWYLATYPHVLDEVREKSLQNAHQHYLEYGAKQGYSPNAFFDERWYLRHYPAVAEMVSAGEFTSGFAHYCADGFRINAPHWLFSELVYRRADHRFSLVQLNRRGYLNGYDHFLRGGQFRGRSGSIFYDPALVAILAENYPSYFDSAQGLFSSYVKLPASIADSRRASWYFDPVWYLANYAGSTEGLTSGEYRSALHHYLTTESPREFNPQASFSEEDYARFNPDVVPSIDGGHFRNGYDHFTRHGAIEGRSPVAGVDLHAFSRQASVIMLLELKRYADPYAIWVATSQDVQPSDRALTLPPEESTRALFLKEARVLAPMIVRRKIDFRYDGSPELSVIIVARDNFTLTLQALAFLRSNYGGAIEVILIDSGSTDETRDIERYVLGAVVRRFRYNIGYLEGCNAAVEIARGPFILYLNNDIRLYPNAIRNALKRIHSATNIAAIGAKIVRTNMRLQEAGSIIWRDGATYGYRRDDDPAIGEANFVRDVDYCSAAFLLVQTDVVRELKGFDPLFRPAYFEDADFCLRIINMGRRIVYDPSVMVEHLEFGSSGTKNSIARMQINFRLLGRQHQDVLRSHQPAHVRNAVIARARKTSRLKVLFLEDRLPLRRLGSGYVRSNDIIWAMHALGYDVTVFPVLKRESAQVDLVSDFPEDVELMTAHDLEDFTEFCLERAGYFDLVWVGRTHNLTRLIPFLSEHSRYLPIENVILDTEVVATPRTLEKARILKLPKPEKALKNLLIEELDSAHYCRNVVTVTARDADLVRLAGYEDVSVLGHSLRLRPTEKAYNERSDFLFVGAFHDVDAPNYDSIVWLGTHVMPFLDPLLLPDVKISIAGYLNPQIEAEGFIWHPRFNWLGMVDRLEPLYDSHRVFIAPTRYAGGLPYKVHEAASFGLPIVATTLLAEQVGWKDGETISAAPADAPERFAERMAELYLDEKMWTTLRYGAFECVENDCSPDKFKNALSEILDQCEPRLKVAS